MLAQSAANLDVGKVLVAVGVLVAAVLVLAVVMLKLRRRLLANEDAGGAPLTLHDLRQLRVKGAMSEEEFERAKAALIGSVGGGRPGRPAPERGAEPETGYPSTGEPPAGDSAGVRRG